MTYKEVCHRTKALRKVAQVTTDDVRKYGPLLAKRRAYPGETLFLASLLDNGAFVTATPLTRRLFGGFGPKSSLYGYIDPIYKELPQSFWLQVSKKLANRAKFLRNPIPQVYTDIPYKLTDLLWRRVYHQKNLGNPSSVIY